MPCLPLGGAAATHLHPSQTLQAKGGRHAILAWPPAACALPESVDLRAWDRPAVLDGCCSSSNLHSGQRPH
jgi:hypothetical protein